MLLSVLREILLSLSGGGSYFFFPKRDEFTGCSQGLCAASQALADRPLSNSPLVPLGKYYLVLYLD